MGTDRSRWMRHAAGRSAGALMLLGLLIPLAGPAHAQHVPPALYGALRWRNIGPFEGGRVEAVAGVPGEPGTFYFGAVNGGVWETRDAGRWPSRPPTRT